MEVARLLNTWLVSCVEQKLLRLYFSWTRGILSEPLSKSAVATISLLKTYRWIFLLGFQISPCKDLIFPRGPNLAQKPVYLVGTVLNATKRNYVLGLMQTSGKKAKVKGKFTQSKGKAKTSLHGLPMCFFGCVALSEPSNYRFALTSMSFRDLPLL